MPLGNKQGGRKMRLKGFFALALTAALSCAALAYKPALAEDTGLDMGTRYDGRWVRCRRPMVMVGAS